MAENIVNVINSSYKITVTSESTNNESLDVVVDNDGQIIVTETGGISAVYSRDLPVGYPLSFTTGTLGVDRITGLPVTDIVAGSGIEIDSNDGVFNISLGEHQHELEAHEHDASDIISGLFDTARLGLGTADGTKFLRGDQTWTESPTNYSTSVWEYRARTTTSVNDYPGNGRIVWNGGSQDTSTSIYVSHLTDNSIDIELILSFIEEGQEIFIQDRDMSENYQRWLISGTPTLYNPSTSTAYFDFPVTLVSASGTGSSGFGHNHNLLFGVARHISYHLHSASEITDFDTAVSGLLPDQITVDGSGYVNVELINNNYIVSVEGLQPSGDYSLQGHTHTSSDITDFNTSVSGLLPPIPPQINIEGAGYVNVDLNDNTYSISVDGLQPSGNYSVVGHTHTSNDITDFNETVSGLIPTQLSIDGSGYVVVDLVDDVYIVGVTGLQPSGNYSEIGHTHDSSDITDFVDSVNALIPDISGTDGYLSRFSGVEDLINSVIYQNGNNIGIGTTSPSGVLHVNGVGLFNNGLRLGTSSSSGIIIGLSTSSSIPAIIFDTIGNNHGFNQSLYEIRENGTALFWIDGNGNFNTGTGNFIATGTNPSTDTGVFGGHGMRRRLGSAGMEFAWGETIVSTTEPGIDLFPISGTHITNGILFRLSKNSTKSDVALLVNGSGNVGVGTTTPAYRLDVNGSLNAHTINVSGVALTEYIDDEINGLLVAGSGIILNYNDIANTLTISTSGTGGGLKEEEVDDRVSSLLVAGSGIELDYNDVSNSLTINAVHNDILFDIDGSTTYTGNAPPGSLTSSSVWVIKQTVYDSGGSVVTNLSAINVAWDDRLTETYS